MLFSVYLSITIDFLFQVVLICFSFDFQRFFGEFFLVGSCFYVSGVDEHNFGIDKAFFNGLRQDMTKDLFEDVGIFESSDIVFSKSCKMWNRFIQTIT